MTPLSVLVHGATGTQGRPVVRRLLADGHLVRGLVRRDVPLPAGVEPVRGNLSDPASLVQAYTGVDAVVVHLPLTFAPSAVSQARAVLDALVETGVPRAVFNTGGPIVAAPVGVPYLDARALLTAGLAGAVGRSAVVGPAGPYLENLSAAWSAPLVAQGEVVYPLPASVAVPWTALDDLAAVIADQLAADTPDPISVVVGPEALTGDQVAAGLSASLGRAVGWRTISHDEYGDLLVPHLGEEAGRGIAGFYARSDGPPPAPDTWPVRRGSTTLAAWAAASGLPRRSPAVVSAKDLRR